ncbi:MAG: excinuclease ABC subunit UvrA, partial [Spirochaetota bacterium]|nr:excinuclease ABC subunit UvrA [Spirochaetota bacterium]
MSVDNIIIKGAREHNLKNISLELPRNQFIVITGVSGSGKSSLAFDTIYAEGQRRYVESLSAYARQFLGQMEKPEVDYIGGLSPAISIEQKTTHRNPRSTVGTITEVYDYLRLLYARCGTPHCPSCGAVVESQSIDQIVDSILNLPDKTKIQVLAPVARGRKGEYKKELEKIRQNGFIRARVDGQVKSLEEPIELDKNKNHNIDVIVDRVIIKTGIRERLVDSVETALALADGLVTIWHGEAESLTETLYSEHMACFACGISLPELQPRIFSFNSPHGACPDCHGIGEMTEFDRDLVIPDWSKSLLEGAVAPIRDIQSSKWYFLQFEALSRHYKFSMHTAVKDLDPDAMEVILYGSGDEEIEFTYTSRNRRSTFKSHSVYEGIIPMLERRYKETLSDGAKDYYSRFMKSVPCQTCNGHRLRAEALAVKVNDRNIIDITSLSVKSAVDFFNNLILEGQNQAIAEKILKEIIDRLSFLFNVGLGYLSLDRKAGTLSGGEMQRIRLATQIGSQLVGVLYVLDEPTIGLHQRDNQKLIDTLTHLRDLGNTLIVVEHDDQTIMSSDYVVDLGPGAGVHGGQITAQGTPKEIMANPDSLTGRYLSGAHSIELPSRKRHDTDNHITLTGCDKNNLKNLGVKFPLSRFIVVTGVSGSGKSTLVNETLFPALMKRVSRSKSDKAGFKSVTGYEEIDKIINIDQSPIGRTPRSNPAT